MRILSPKALALFATNQRKQLGLTQSEVADIVGLKQKTISAFENKPESVKLETAFLILSALHLDIDLRLKDKNNMEERIWNQEW